LISGVQHPPYLVLLTTTSALGRSSIYNRMKLNGRQFWTSVGYTQGSGEFHFSNGVYADMRAFAESKCDPSAKQAAWGKGFRNKREVIKKCLPRVGLSSDLMYHGVQREIFVAPLAEGALSLLRGDVQLPCFWDSPADQLSDAFLQRWLLPRAERVLEFLEFDRESYRLWPNRQGRGSNA